MTATPNANGPAPLARQGPSNKTVMDLLVSKRTSFEQIATKHLSADRLLKCVGVALSRIPKLARCTPTSLLQCVMTCAQLGLDPSGVLGSAYLIPYEDKRKGTVICQLIIGYRGMIDLCRRSGDVLGIQAWLVYKGDEFELRAGTDDPGILHKPNIEAERKNEDIIGAYAVAKLSESVTQFEWMSRREIDAIRGRSRASNAGPWVSDYGEMAKKTVIRRLCKSLPLSVETAEQIDTVTRADPTMAVIDIEGQSEEVEDAPQQGSEGLQKALDKQPVQPATTVQTAPGPMTEAEKAKIIAAEKAAAAPKPSPTPAKYGFDAHGHPLGPPEEDEPADPPHDEDLADTGEAEEAQEPVVAPPPRRRSAAKSA